MPSRVTQQRQNTAYAGLDFIKAAFCPLEFNAMPLQQHPHWAYLKRDQALAALEVSQPLEYARQFPFTDQHGNRKTATQIVTAPFGLAPKDFDFFLGLYTYLKRLPELPIDGRSYLTVDFLAKQLQLPATCQKDYQRIRSRVFRFSFVKYTNTAFWSRERRTYDIKNFGFYNLAAMSRFSESRRPIEFEWDPSFLRIVRDSTLLTFDYEFYLTLAPALRRLYLIANRDGWNQRDSSLFVADDFAIHQIGYDEKPQLKKLRLQKLKKLLAQAETLGIVRPFAPWQGYLHTLTQGRDAGKLGLRWSRGPRLRQKAEHGQSTADRLEHDALYAQVQELRDEHGQPCSPAIYRTLVAKFGRAIMQKQIVVVLAQQEHHPGDFKKSALAAFINRCQHDHPEPDWYRDLQRAERVAAFSQVQPSHLSRNVYETFFRE